MVRKAIFFTEIFSLFLFFSFFSQAGEVKEKFPFAGEITSDKVNVRAGQNINFERLCSLSKGEEVVIVDKSYDWYKIKLPESARCYIAERYVRLLSENIGVVSADRVNIRAGQGEGFSVIGQVNQGAKVKIRGEKEGWYEIQPPSGSYGWVNHRFVIFKSEEIPPPTVITEPTEKTDKKTVVALNNIEKEREPELFSVVGRIEDLGRIVRSKNIRYKLIAADKTVYYLEGDPRMIDRFVHHTVKVEGKLKSRPEGFYAGPVISVYAIDSVL